VPLYSAGTTAFPSVRWKDNNGPEQTDFIGSSNLVAAVAAQSPNCKRFVLVSSIGGGCTSSVQLTQAVCCFITKVFCYQI
jgi:hypothetical protein